MAEIDVIIPTRDRATLVVRAIDSVLAQTLAPRRVIVVDDGSTDETPEVLKRYGEKILIVQSEGLGVSAARNAGISAGTLLGSPSWIPTISGSLPSWTVSGVSSKPSSIPTGGLTPKRSGFGMVGVSIQ